MPRSSYRTSSERALEAIYAEIPAIPECDGRCWQACGPIAMFEGEWARVTRSFGSAPRLPQGSLVCPLLSPAGRCMVYSVRPYICRIWGATPTLRCPHGCEPERWLTVKEAHGLFARVRELAGPGTDGPIRGVDDLWDAIALAAREQASAIHRPDAR